MWGQNWNNSQFPRQPGIVNPMFSGGGPPMANASLLGNPPGGGNSFLPRNNMGQNQNWSPQFNNSFMSSGMFGNVTPNPPLPPSKPPPPGMSRFPSSSAPPLPKAPTQPPLPGSKPPLPGSKPPLPPSRPKPPPPANAKPPLPTSNADASEKRSQPPPPPPPNGNSGKETQAPAGYLGAPPPPPPASSSASGVIKSGTQAGSQPSQKQGNNRSNDGGWQPLQQSNNENGSQPDKDGRPFTSFSWGNSGQSKKPQGLMDVQVDKPGPKPLIVQDKKQVPLSLMEARAPMRSLMDKEGFGWNQSDSSGGRNFNRDSYQQGQANDDGYNEDENPFGNDYAYQEDDYKMDNSAQGGGYGNNYGNGYNNDDQYYGDYDNNQGNYDEHYENEDNYYGNDQEYNSNYQGEDGSYEDHDGFNSYQGGDNDYHEDGGEYNNSRQYDQEDYGNDTNWKEDTPREMMSAGMPGSWERVPNLDAKDHIGPRRPPAERKPKEKKAGSIPEVHEHMNTTNKIRKGIGNMLSSLRTSNPPPPVEDVRDELPRKEQPAEDAAGKTSVMEKEWFCARCQKKNFLREDCYHCKVPRVGTGNQARLNILDKYPKSLMNQTSTLKVGDWVCYKCQNLNFGRRTDCNRCKEKKPAPGSPESLIIDEMVIKHLTEAASEQGDKEFRSPFLSNQQDRPGGSQMVAPPELTEAVERFNELARKGAPMGEFDKALEEWESNFTAWMNFNRGNPNRMFVQTVIGQLEDISSQLWKKRDAVAAEKKKAMQESWFKDQDQTQHIQPMVNIDEEQEEPKESAAEIARRLLCNNSDESDEENAQVDRGNRKRHQEDFSQEAKRSRFDDFESQENPMRHQMNFGRGQNEMMGGMRPQDDRNSPGYPQRMMRDSPGMGGMRPRDDRNSPGYPQRMMRDSPGMGGMRPQDDRNSPGYPQRMRADSPGMGGNRPPGMNPSIGDSGYSNNQRSGGLEALRKRLVQNVNGPSMMDTVDQYYSKQQPVRRSNAPGMSEVINRYESQPRNMNDRGSADENMFVRKSDLDHQSGRPSYNSGWNPKAVKDYSVPESVPPPTLRREDFQQAEFRPRSFDWGHRDGGPSEAAQSDFYRGSQDSGPSSDYADRNNSYDNMGGRRDFDAGYSGGRRDFDSGYSGGMRDFDAGYSGRRRDFDAGYGGGPHDEYNHDEGGYGHGRGGGGFGQPNFRGQDQFGGRNMDMNNYQGFNNRRQGGWTDLPPPPPMAKPKQPAGKKIALEDLVSPPGRYTRPPRMVIIMRGLPGAGKTHVAKIIKEKETEEGADPPRVMALDDYFMTDGQYEYDEDLEESYRDCLVKSFKKNIDGGYFSFLIVDAINHKLDHFNTMWSHAKQNGFEVYICEVTADLSTCFTRNIHDRKEAQIKAMKRQWQKTPDHMNTLDISSILQDAGIDNVEMKDEVKTEVKEESADPPSADGSEISEIKEEVEEEDSGETSFLKTSKWEIMDREEKLARLDGTTEKVKKGMHHHTSIEDWLEIGDSYSKKDDGKKRVRWADLEMRKEQAKVKEFGFVLGRRMYSDKEEADREAASLLTSTKIIPNRFQSEFHNQ